MVFRITHVSTRLGHIVHTIFVGHDQFIVHILPICIDSRVGNSRMANGILHSTKPIASISVSRLDRIP